MRKIKDNSKFNSAHQNMLSAVVTFATNAANIAITQSIAAFLAIINALKVKLDDIIKIQGDINNPVTGVADQKELAKNTLVQTSILIMHSVYAYAMKNNNAELAAKMNVSKSKMERMKDSVLTGTVDAAIANVTEVLANLGAYNIDQDLLDAWKGKLKNFTDMVSDPKIAHDGIDVFRNKLQDLLRASVILMYNEADTVAMQYKLNNIDYYRGYRKARKLQPLVKHTKLRILVTTEQGMPVNGIIVTQDKSSNYIVTDINGRADLYIQIPKGTEIATNGIYSFTLSKDTMNIKTGDIEIKKGSTVTKNFVWNENNFEIPDAPAAVEKELVLVNK